MKLWIARTKGGFKKGYLTVFEKEPFYNEHKDEWVSFSGKMIINNEEFPEITFENSPQEIEFKFLATGADRGRRDSIIRGLKQLEKDYMLSYEEEIEWLNQLVKDDIELKLIKQ